MKSRRRICLPKAQDYAHVEPDYISLLRPAEWGSTVILRGNNPQDRMSALGHKQTLGRVRLMSALPPKADIAKHWWDVAKSRHFALRQRMALFDHLVGGGEQRLRECQA
jgi:hypothetical protein